MKSKSYVLVGLIALTGAVACSQNSSSSSGPTGAIPTVVSTDDAERAAKAAREAEMDLSSSGGQPGTITLAGAAWAKGQPDPRVKIFRVAAGRGWRVETTAKILGEPVQYKPELSESTSKELAEAKADKTYIKIGCDDDVLPAASIEKRPDFAGLTEAPRSSDLGKNPVLNISAHSVILCGHSREEPLKNIDVVRITAHSIYMNGFGHDMVGTSDKSFSLTSTNLVLDGSSGITAKGENGPTTLLAGPSISITAQEIMSDGDLHLVSDGADYVAPETEAVQPK